MKRIARGEKTYAFVLSTDDFEPGAKFVSERDWPLQVGLMTLPLGYTIQAHAHLVQDSLRAQSTQEFLFVVSGKMVVDFFDESGEHFHTETLPEGKALLHICGGHAFRFLEPTRLIEVKSGPYAGRDKDKVFLDTCNPSDRLDSARSVDGYRREIGFANALSPVRSHEN